MALRVVHETPGADGSPEEARAVALRVEERTFLRRLVELREQAGLNQTQVAGRMGIDRSFVSRFEKFDSAPRMDTIVRYAHAIGARLHLDAELECEDLAASTPSMSEWLSASMHVSVGERPATSARKMWVDARC
ncbi:helix-turn-helix transcriptional regulator [Dietzia maris]|jgi:transcriptional regulator with XRE-family HTH domain|nr:helix-turn-helix transcriptional regulator [Dietzia maris]MBB0998488.1 helix-turn-helix transcriptional regulator [Dietzia maris]